MTSLYQDLLFKAAAIKALQQGSAEEPSLLSAQSSPTPTASALALENTLRLLQRQFGATVASSQLLSLASESSSSGSSLHLLQQQIQEAKAAQAKASLLPLLGTSEATSGSNPVKPQLASGGVTKTQAGNGPSLGLLTPSTLQQNNLFLQPSVSQQEVERLRSVCVQNSGLSSLSSLASGIASAPTPPAPLATLSQAPPALSNLNPQSALASLNTTSTSSSILFANGSVIPPRRRARGGVIEPFPEKLHRLLTEVELAGRGDVVSFVAQGRAFIIHKPDVFVRDIIPLYFCQSRLTSFKRQLNIYGFQLIHNGPARGGYFHPLFVKDFPNLCQGMRRVAATVKVSKSKEGSTTDAKSTTTTLSPAAEESPE